MSILRLTAANSDLYQNIYFYYYDGETETLVTSVAYYDGADEIVSQHFERVT